MFLNNISKFISAYQYGQASDETLIVAKAAFLDFIGVTLRGFKEKPSQYALMTMGEIFQGNLNFDLEASIIGKSDNKTDVLTAGLINGISAHSLELDDGHRTAQMHLGAIVFPTAIAIAEAYDLSGEEFLEAVIIGYEIGIMLGQIANPQHRDKGFHSTGTIGTFVAGAVASKLLKLDTDQIINVLGLCGTQAAGLLESDHSGSMGKVLHAGKAVYNGILSAFLAKNDFTGSESIIEGNEGFLNTMVYTNNSLTKNNHNLEKSLKELKEIKFRDIYFKKYPFCRHLHSAIDTTLKLRSTIGDEYLHIESITVKTYKTATEHNNYSPKNIEQLKQSLPYAVAISLVCGEVTVNKIDELIKYGLLDAHSEVSIVKHIKSLASRVVLVLDEKLNSLYPDKRPSNIVIKLDESFRNGIFQNITLIPKGDYENPFELKELLEKFRVLNPDFDVNNLVIIDNIEKEQSMRNVIETLNGGL
ncbi:MmgE/PrpD family protein [Methanobrevibacter woesei]|uniref:MmgE/PrpD family protein n=1 Tax=Methanobrevibacter woesei TaxID=190976 RepID=UPI002357F8E1|nr:MmgE/PrpD family protein [Methanobrevibacter woesei]